MKKTTHDFATLLQSFFMDRLVKQRNASPHTIKSYRDTFRLLLRFTQEHLQKAPSNLNFVEIDAPLVARFLETLEEDRNVCARSRNLRLTAIRSFFRYAALEMPTHSAQIQRVLAIPGKRHERPLVQFLTQPEIKALLAAPDQKTRSGRRDHALILVAVHTGLRLSELIALRRQNVALDTGAHVRVTGKGRKERCTPLTKQTVTVLKAWMDELGGDSNQPLFPGARGKQLSADGVQYILSKHSAVAGRSCPSLAQKRVTPHTLRHTMAMELLLAGVDRAMIALWLGHESVETTQIYLHANLVLKEQLLAKTSLPQGTPGLYRPDDNLLAFLTSL
ncbi:site-specific integrase [soil metagenome]